MIELSELLLTFNHIGSRLLTTSTRRFLSQLCVSIQYFEEQTIAVAFAWQCKSIQAPKLVELPNEHMRYSMTERVSGQVGTGLLLKIPASCCSQRVFLLPPKAIKSVLGLGSNSLVLRHGMISMIFRFHTFNAFIQVPQTEATFFSEAVICKESSQHHEAS